jgi:2-polyprenyl-3-methyl-5-hydroxy-6-metoxy-1,4-benzoquinol methylase
MTHILQNILACPTCRQTLAFEQTVHCPNCHKQVEVDGRLYDFSYLTPDLPLYFAKLTKDLHAYAGKVMKDLPLDWRMRKVLDLTKHRAQGPVCLEIGGADGPMTPHLEDLFRVVLTIDFSKPFLKRIESKTSQAICLFGDAQFLPIQDGVIDTIVCSEVLEHVPVPTQLLAEIRRVMSKDAVCILSVPYEARTSFRKKVGAANQLAKDTHVSFFNPTTLDMLLFRMGLETIDMQCISSIASIKRALLKRPLSAIFTLLMGQYILCSLRAMDDPQLFWQMLANQWSQSGPAYEPGNTGSNSKLSD